MTNVYLPIHIRRLIFSYLIQQRQFYIQDLGSTHGTYAQISESDKYQVRKGQSYLIGADIYLNVIELQTT